MNKQEAEPFLQLVNDVGYYKLILEYAEYRIKLLQKSMETLVDINDILRIQGQIKELRRFETLKDEVKNPTDKIVKIRDYNI